MNVPQEGNLGSEHKIACLVVSGVLLLVRAVVTESYLSIMLPGHSLKAKCQPKSSEHELEDVVVLPEEADETA
ncbi:hypothetical protein BGW37DRAFT_519207 [Umbelopsis sp. PMI_123]|nr:hypothetical protein BGW37DRAFT_519207 [Umbelopsis sp. PMI_123]